MSLSMRLGEKRLSFTLAIKGADWATMSKSGSRYLGHAFHGGQGFQHQEDVRVYSEAMLGGQFQKLLQQFAEMDFLEWFVQVPSHEIGHIFFKQAQVGFFFP